MSDEGSNYFFVVLPSNVTDYTDNMTSRYRVHLPKPIQFRGAWVCGLYSIQYPHSWASTVGTVEQQWVDIHNQDGETVRVDLPKTSQQTAQGLKEYLNRTITATLAVNRRYRRSKRNAEETADELRRQQQHDGSSADEGGSVVCTKTGRRTVCRRIKPLVPSDDDAVKTAVTTPTTAQTTTTTTTAKEVPDQARPLSQVEKLGEKMKEKLNSQQRNEEFEKAKETDTANPKRLPTDKEEEEEEKKSTKRLPTDKEEEEKEKTSSKSQEKEIFKEKPLATTTTKTTLTTPPTPTVSSSPSPVKIAAQTRGEALKGLVEKSQKEKEENKPTTATTRGEALKGILETSGKEKDRESGPATTTTTTRGEVLKALMEKSQQEKEEKKNKEPSPTTTTTTTRGEVLKGLLDTDRKGKGEKEGKELETAKTNEEALKGLVEKGLRKELAPAKTRGEALKQLLERRKEEKAEDDNHFSYRTDIDRFQVVLLDDPDISHLSMSQQIAYVLGFPNKELVERGEIAKYGVDLRGGFTSFAVYATGLTRSVILGNSLSSLLRIVSTDGEYGQVIERIYDNPMFIPVHPREINELQIELRMMDGKLVPFDYGTVLITLVFKKVINF